jgi:hypothetical protein
VEVSPGQEIRSQLAAKIVGKGWPLYELRGVNLSLEEIFLELTGSSHAGHHDESEPGEPVHETNPTEPAAVQSGEQQ